MFPQKAKEDVYSSNRSFTSGERNALPRSPNVACESKDTHQMNESLDNAQSKFHPLNFPLRNTDPMRQNEIIADAGSLIKSTKRCQLMKTRKEDFLGSTSTRASTNFRAEVPPVSFPYSEHKLDRGEKTAPLDESYVSKHHEQNSTMEPNKKVTGVTNEMSLIPFPQKIMKILDKNEFEHIISWLPNGRAFVVHQKETLESDILPRYFKQSKYSSFARRLRRWGFARVTTDTYFHKKFQKGNYLMCMQVNHQAIAKKGKDQGGKPDSPDHLGMDDKNNVFESLKQEIRLPSKAVAAASFEISRNTGDVRNSQRVPERAYSSYLQHSEQQVELLKGQNYSSSVGAFPYTPITNNMYPWVPTNFDASELLFNPCMNNLAYMTRPIINLDPMMSVKVMLQQQINQEMRYLSHNVLPPMGNAYKEALGCQILTRQEENENKNST